MPQEGERSSCSGLTHLALCQPLRPSCSLLVSRLKCVITSRIEGFESELSTSYEALRRRDLHIPRETK